jgi:hypothetical protein
MWQLLVPFLIFYACYNLYYTFIASLGETGVNLNILIHIAGFVYLLIFFWYITVPIAVVILSIYAIYKLFKQIDILFTAAQKKLFPKPPPMTPEQRIVRRKFLAERRRKKLIRKEYRNKILNKIKSVIGIFFPKKYHFAYVILYILGIFFSMFAIAIYLV